MSSVLVAGVTVAQERKIRSALSDPNGSVTRWTGDIDEPGDAAALIEDRPTLVIIGSKIGADAIELSRAIGELDPAVATLLFAKSDSVSLEDALEAGVRGILAPNAKKEAIQHSLDRILRIGERLQAPQPADSPEADRIFVPVVSAKGGAGKTVISSNLAARLAQRTGGDTVLVDLDLQFGDSATALLLAPEYSIADAASAAHRGMDVAALKVFLSTHQGTGLFVLGAPTQPSAGEQIPIEDVVEVLDVLSDQFRCVVVDTDPGLSERTLSALEKATDIVIVVDLDVPSVRGTRKLIEALDLIGMTEARRHVVLNRANSKVGLTPQEVEAALGTKIDVALPSTRQVPLSFNEGRPIVLSGRRTRFARRFEALPDRLVPVKSALGRRR